MKKDLGSRLSARPRPLVEVAEEFVSRPIIQSEKRAGAVAVTVIGLDS